MSLKLKMRDIKKALLFIACASIITVSSAQVKTRALKKMIELQMPRTVDDDMPGTRGACVVWHPVQKKYYAVFAGNMGYPLAVFDGTGKRLSGEDLNAMGDIRGLWYNPSEKRIEGNEYSEAGWFYYKLDEKGLAYEYETIWEGMNQPDAQSVGAYDPSSKHVLFLKGSQVYLYNNEGEYTDTSIVIHWSRTAKEGALDDEDATVAPEEYNYTSLLYTALPGSELGFLNTEKKQVELYNKKDGFLTQVLTVPEGAPVNASFNFAFANGTYWLFDMEKRIWFGYK